MKRAAAIIICATFTAALLCGCAQSRFVSLDAVIERCNSINEKLNLTFTDFTRRESMGMTAYDYVYSAEHGIIVRLICGGGTVISSLRVILPKANEKAEQAAPTQRAIDEFYNAYALFSGAFVQPGQKQPSAENMPKTPKRMNADEEISLTSEKYSLVYLSNGLVSELILSDLYLCEQQTTEKPAKAEGFNPVTVQSRQSQGER